MDVRIEGMRAVEREQNRTDSDVADDAFAYALYALISVLYLTGHPDLPAD
jgi:hypothetical protein